jgi:outer membrane protein OmpU
MRKVLLATTALVAMTGAAAAEVGLSGYYEFGYATMDDDLTADRDTMFTEGEIHFNFTNTADNGMTLGFHTQMVTHSHEDRSTGEDMDSSYLSISSDMGTFRLGEYDSIESTFATYHPGGRNMITGDDWTLGVVNASGAAITSGLKSSATGGAYGDVANFTYLSPSMGGLTFGMTYELGDTTATASGGEYQSNNDSGDNADTAVGAGYSTEVGGASVSIQAQVADNGESSSSKVKTTTIGTNISFGDISLAVSKVDYESGTTTESDTMGYGIGYQVTDDLSIAVNLVDSEATVSGSTDDLDTTSYSVSYNIVPGLNFALALNSSDFVDSSDSTKNMKSDEMRASIQASF